MSISVLQLYGKLGEQEAESLVNFVQEEVKQLEAEKIHQDFLQK